MAMTIREFEALVAEKVMGWKRQAVFHDYQHFGQLIKKFLEPGEEVPRGYELWWIPPDGLSHQTTPPAYASTWSGLGLVVEEMENNPDDISEWYLELGAPQFGDGPPYPATFYPNDATREPVTAWADTRPMAVALAALRAVGAEIPEGEVQDVAD